MTWREVKNAQDWKRQRRIVFAKGRELQSTYLNENANMTNDLGVFCLFIGDLVPGEPIEQLLPPANIIKTKKTSNNTTSNKKLYKFSQEKSPCYLSLLSICSSPSSTLN